MADSDAGQIAPDEDSQKWLDGLGPGNARHGQCVREPHGLLLRAARREVQRRRSWLGGAPPGPTGSS
jgi:hypothetical protein